jgi:hypothetical protein
VVGVSAFGYTYQFISGSGFYISLDLTDSIGFKFLFMLFSEYHLNFKTEDVETLISFNLIPALFIIWIDRAIEKIKKEQQQQLIESFIPHTTSQD